MESREESIFYIFFSINPLKTLKIPRVVYALTSTQNFRWPRQFLDFAHNHRVLCCSMLTPLLAARISAGNIQPWVWRFHPCGPLWCRKSKLVALVGLPWGGLLFSSQVLTNTGPHLGRAIAAHHRYRRVLGAEYKTGGSPPSGSTHPTEPFLVLNQSPSFLSLIPIIYNIK